MSRGWVVYANDKYLPLLEVLLRSLSLFSSLDVAVFVNEDSPILLKCTNHTLHRIGMPNPYWAKLIAATRSPFDESCLIDADTIAYRNIDQAWAFFSDHDAPLFCMHPWASEKTVYQRMRASVGNPGLPVPYAHACPCFYGYSGRQWLLRVEALMSEYNKSGDTPGDEELINLLLAKEGNYERLPYLFVDRTVLWRWPMPFYAIHGEKNPLVARRLLHELISDGPDFAALSRV